MPNKKTGVWLIGARGNVAATATLGLCALQQGLSGTSGLVTELPELAGLDLPSWDSLVIGGHDIRSERLIERAALLGEERVVPAEIVPKLTESLEEIDARIHPGTLYGCGERIRSLGDEKLSKYTAESPRAAIERIKADYKEFCHANKLDRCVVVYLASTEPVVDVDSLPTNWDALNASLDNPTDCQLKASSLYAIAAVEGGYPFVNFTPSLGATCDAIEQLAMEKKVSLAGRDGKTGETLLKTVLSPMFAHRNLQVMSWVGHNIFGNMDGQVLDDPANKATKIRSKDSALESLLGYSPQSLISIEYIKSLGDWKTAWDHVHFKGFLGTNMTLQFTWQGCDSALAAPLVLDLARLVCLADDQGLSGSLPQLACFFKSPVGTTEHDFAKQYQMLLDWVAQ